MAPSSHDTLFIQFAREPVPGKVKTRMQPHLTATEAAALHCALVEWTTLQLLGSGLGAVQLWVSGRDTHPLFQQCKDHGVADICVQQGADLGLRMSHAFEHSLAHFTKVVLVGSDCPALDAAYLAAALEALDSAPVVIGEAKDGGYVLIGATQICGAVFENIDWGTAAVFRQTGEALRRNGIEYATLPALADIDRPEDLAIWERVKRRQPQRGR